MMTLKVNWRLWMKRLIGACMDVWLNNRLKLIPWLLAVRHVCGGREADSQNFYQNCNIVSCMAQNSPALRARLKLVFFVLYSLTVRNAYLRWCGVTRSADCYMHVKLLAVLDSIPWCVAACVCNAPTARSRHAPSLYACVVVPA